MTKIYATISGDTWDIISYKLYGSEYYIDELIQANLQYVDTIIFESDIRLNVPEITKKSSVELPLWKQT